MKINPQDHVTRCDICKKIVGNDELEEVDGDMVCFECLENKEGDHHDS